MVSNFFTFYILVVDVVELFWFFNLYNNNVRYTQMYMYANENTKNKKKLMVFFWFDVKAIYSIYNLTFERQVTFPWVRFLYCLIKGGPPAMPESRRPEGMAGCPRRAKTRESQKGKEIEKERKKRRQIQFHRKYWGISRRALSPKTPRDLAASAFFYLTKVYGNVN